MLMNGFITKPDLTTDTTPPTATDIPTEEPSVTPSPEDTPEDTPEPSTDEPDPVPSATLTRTSSPAPTATATTEPTHTPTLTRTPQPTTPRPTATRPAETDSVLRIASKDSGARNEQHGHFRYQLTNTGQQAQSNIAVRFYFTPAPREASDYVLDTYYDSSGAADVTEPVPVNDSLYYFEVRYTMPLAPGENLEFQGNIRLQDWSHQQTPSDDFWRNSPTASTFQATDALPVFVDGELVTGRTP
jgi:hypothetical protein